MKKKKPRRPVHISMRLIVSFLVCLLSMLIISLQIWKCVNKDKITSKLDQDLFLLIGILSGRENFKARESVRKTWLQHTDNEQEKHYFLVGNQFCSVPIVDRISEFSCDEWRVNLPHDVNKQSEFISSRKLKHHHKVLDLSFKILVHENIIIKRLCILPELISSRTRVSVADLATNEVIISATFTNIHDSSGDDFVCKSAELFSFPKYFEGKIAIESPAYHDGACDVAITDTSNLITYKSSRSRNVRDICTPVSMVYMIQDLQSLQHFLNGTNIRKENWLKEQKSIQSDLMKEVQEFNDIIFLDVIDVYRNLPHKILEFFKWCGEQKLKFLLKTDDDTFINVMKVRKILKSVGDVKDWWWSSFRENWPVQTSGKWRDDDYVSKTYPPFPCGAGYVLSADLVSFLSLNADRLHCYQGEDVSVGIWLAPVNPELFNDCWQCNGCVQSACNVPQLSVRQMFETWNLLLNSSNLCP